MTDQVLNTESLNILIVDDEKAARYGMIRALKPDGYRLTEAEDGLAALRLLEMQSFDIVITDVAMPGISGLELLQKIRNTSFNGLVIVITAHGSERLAVEAMKAGAYDYIAKPYDIEELRMIVAGARKHILLQRENETLRNELRKSRGTKHFLGESEAMRSVFNLIDKVSQSDVTVLIRGESGTGKEMAARTIHDQSERRHGPFVSVNCAAIPRELIESELFGYEKGAFTGAASSKPGRFELAHHGTLFLDEIGDMSLDTQAKVLRVLQERKFERVGGAQSIEVDVRIISATHQDLQKAIREGTFREDLYYRIHVVEIVLPPLRERNGDIPLLLNHFLALYAAKHRSPAKRFSSVALKILLDYHWPGNIRELMNVVERCVVLSSTEEISPDLLPENILREQSSSPVSVRSFLDLQHLTFQEAKERVVESFERQYLIEAMRRNQWNITQTAAKIGVKRQYLQMKLKELGINVKEEKELS